MGTFATHRDATPSAALLLLVLPGARRRRGRQAAALGVGLSLLVAACGPAVGGGSGGGDGGKPDVGDPDRWAPWDGAGNHYKGSLSPGQPSYVDGIRFQELEFRGDGTVVIAMEICPGTLTPPAPAGELTYRHEDLYAWELGEDGYPRLAFVSHTDEEDYGHLYADAVELEVRPGPGCDELAVWGRREGEPDLARWGSYAPGDLCMQSCTTTHTAPDASVFDYCAGAPPPACE